MRTDLITVDLGEGDWATIWPEFRHKTFSALQKNLRRYLKPKGKPKLLSELTAETVLDDFELDTVSFDREEANDIKLLNQVLELSWGPVTQAALDNMPKRKYDLLIAEVEKICDLPLAEVRTN